jgi:biotin synthase
VKNITSREGIIQRIQKLEQEHALAIEDYEYLIENRTPETDDWIRYKAVQITRSIYGRDIYVRGLIEFTNICRNNCYYCGIRKDNPHVRRYRLSQEEILSSCKTGHALGFRTFVLQGGEDAYFTDDRLCAIVSEIHERYPDCAITLSVGERSAESYRRLYEAGAERYLLRHETADADHYRLLHPSTMSFAHRMDCIRTLRDIGYAVGIGMMIGAPYQTARHLAEDLKFIETFQPEMCGIGPFIPHGQTPLKDFPAGSVDLTCYLLALIRLICPDVLLPATTALGTMDPKGREKGVLSGANVVMPNLSPTEVRKDYQLYDNKICTGEESAQCRGCLERRMLSIGYQVVTDRGDKKNI